MAPPILVTGAHRSGTTWVGRVLALDPRVEYVQEPFNVERRNPTMRVRPRHWFEFVTDENESRLLGPMGEVISGRYPSRRGGSVRRVVDAVRSRRRLLKDPIALMSAPWLADRFACSVLVMVRHPAAFTGSLKRLGWQFDFRNWTDQPLFMRDIAGPYAPQIRRFAKRQHDIVDQSILLWNVTHALIARYRAARRDWTFVRHEDVCEAPVERFRALYAEFGLRWNETVEAAVRAGSTADSPIDLGVADRNGVMRDSRRARWTWVRRLTRDEQARIRDGTAEVAASFYADADWNAPPERATEVPRSPGASS